MAVYKRTYKVYQGGLTPSWSRFAVLTRYSLSTLFDSKLFTAYALFCLVPILGAIAQIYITHSQTAQLLLNARFNGILSQNNVWFELILRFQCGFGFILVAWAAPGLITRDFANQALQLYFSRPLSRTEYILGKISVLAVLLSFITWIPCLVLFGLEAQMEGNGWGWSNFYLVGSIFIASWLWIAIVSLLALALSVSVKWRIAGTALIVGVFFLLAGFGAAFSTILGTNWGTLLNLPYVMNIVRGHLFRLAPKFYAIGRGESVPLWSAWAMIFLICLISIFLLNRRLKAREVVRG
jgi:ABC-2 type transport system permease protein